MRPAWCVPIFAMVLSAQAPISVTAPIQRVRLHPDEAWVTRVGRTRVQWAGTHRFLLADLPSGLDIQDVQVSARGPLGTVLGDFGIGVNTREPMDSPEYQALRKEREALQERKDTIESEVGALDQEVKFLNEFRAAYDKDVSTKLVSGAVSGASVVDVSTSLSSRLAAVLAKTRKLRRELSECNEEIERLHVKMRQMTSERNARLSRATVEITTPRVGDLEIEITYRTREARWNPAYEARLAMDNRNLELVLYASIRQTSGEDWSNVKLEITNARASRSLVMPTLPGAQVITWSEQLPGRVFGLGGVGGPPPPVTEQGLFAAQNAYIQPDFESKESPMSDADDARPVEAASVEEIQGLATTWSLEGVKDVPSDGESHRFRIVSSEIEPVLALMAIPRIDPTVYRVARFPIPSGIPLFPGASIVHFAGTQRVGVGSLAVPAAGQPIQLGFGPYRGIRVALSRVDARKDNIGTFTKETQWTLSERFEISNDLNERVTVEVQDRELRSGNDRVRIIFQPETAPLAENQIPGILRWKLDLQPKATVNMPFTYQIRVPQGQGHTFGIENLNLPR